MLYGKKMRLLSLVLALAMVFSMMPVQVFAATTSPFTLQNGDIGVAWSVSYSGSSGVTKNSETKMTIVAQSATAALGGKGGATTTVIITNNFDNDAILTFDYTLSGEMTSCSLGSSSSSYSGTLVAGGTLTITLKGKSRAMVSDASLVLESVTLNEIVPNPVVTVNYDSSLGSVAVGDETVSSGYSTTVTLGDTVTVVATAGSGTTFMGWVNDNGRILSADTSYTFAPTSNNTLKPVFVSASSGLCFGVGGTTKKSESTGLLGLSSLTYYTASPVYIFDNLNEAIACATANALGAIVLLNSGTLSAGTYTIPAGVTLLIPFDSANTMYTTAAQATDAHDVTSTDAAGNQTTATDQQDYSTPTEYRVLTMADGAHLVLNGAMSLSAKHAFAQGSKYNGGSPTGPCSFVKMQGNSSITINDGGALYAYGFITGSGSVTANNGATVYENFQIMDFRGGTQSTAMKNGVFPLSQYYVQNIEVPLTLNYGAKEYAYTTVYMSSSKFGTAIQFIGPSGCLFNLTSGNAVKTYNGSTDRLIIDVNGSMTLSSIKMSFGTSSINSSDYDLALNGNITVNINSGTTTVNQDMVLIPGSEVNVAQGATLVLGSGYNVYIYDIDQWGTFCGAIDQTHMLVQYAPGRTGTRAALSDAVLKVEGTVDTSAGYLYTTAGGANIYSSGTGVIKTQAGSETKTYQLIQTTSTYVEIPITPAKLKNADGTTIQSADDTYTYDGSKWNCEAHTWNEGVETQAPTCFAEGVMTYTCSVCGDTKTEAITKLGHTAGAAATCTTAQTCTVCGTQINAALGHTWTAATCTAPKTCSVCSATEGEPNGHSYNSVVTDPACEAQGYTTHTCSVCKDSYVDTYVDKLGHSYESVVTAPACTEQGYTTNTCTACGASNVSDYVSALGHTEAGAVVENNVDPTCTAAGSYDTVVYCSVCNEELSRVTTTVDALGHTEVVDAAKEPTCTETGLTEGKHCSVCGTTIVAQEVVPAKGHSYDEGEVTEAPTCNGEGVKTYTCGTCGGTYTEAVDATGHTEVAVEKVAPTCTTTGLTAGTKCSDCDTTIVAQEVVLALGHSYDAGEVTTAPTCTKVGVKTFTCGTCGDTMTEEVAATGHTEGSAVIENEVEATCTANGSYDTVVYCAVCDTEQSRVATTVPAMGHTAGSAVTENKVDADCDDGGSYDTVVYCTVCDTEISRETTTVPATGHTAEDVPAVAPTCTATGLTAGTKCSVCGEVLVAQTVVDALGHTEVTDAAVAATCTETGLTEGKHCSVCNKVLVAQTGVDALGHSYSSVVTAPTFEAQGYTTHICATCGDSYVDSYVDALTAVASIGDERYVSLAAAFDAAQDGDTITLLTDVTLDAYLSVTTAGKITLDLNGHKITREGTGIYVNNVSTELTITGNGTITAQHAVWAAAGKVTIENGTFHGTDVTVYTSGTGAVVIKGGTFSADATDGVGTADKYCVLNQMDSARDTSSITVYGGTFVGFDPANNASEGANTNFCAEGYCAKADGTNYVVDKHSYNAVVTAPTCTEAGYTTHTCERCGNSYNDTEVDALGHSEKTTYTHVDGTTTHTVAVSCETCTATISTNTANCTDTDNNFACDSCGGLLVNAYADAVTMAEEYTGTTTVDGSTVTLKYTGEVKFLPAAGNGDWNHWVGFKITSPVDMSKVTILRPDGATRVMADIKDGDGYAYLYWGMTKDEDKLATYQIDWNGDGAYDLTVILDATDAKLLECEHTWNDGVVTTNPTCIADGEKTYTCANCGATKTEAVAAKGHTEVVDEAVAATCTETGLTEGKHCDVCGEVLVAQKVVAALGHTEVIDAAVSATCTETGLTAGKHCSVCGEVTVAQEEVAARGHNEEEIPAVEATCTETGLTAGVKCSVCGEILTVQTEIPATGIHVDADGNGVCDDCGVSVTVTYDLSIAGANMTLGNELAMNFFVKKADIQSDKAYYIVVTKTYSDGRDDVVVKYNFADWMDYNSTFYGVKFDDISAKEMSDTIYVQIFYEDGNPASDVWIDSVRDYVSRALKNSSNTSWTKTLLVDMLNYGAAAQKEWTYGTDDLANSLLTDEQMSYATSENIICTDSRIKGDNYYGANLNLGSALTMSMYFKNITPDMYAIITYTNYRGVEKEARIEGSSFEKAGSYYRIYINVAVVADVSELITCTVYTADGTPVASASDSIESYISRVDPDCEAPLYTAVMKFAKSAYNYLMNR